MSFYQTSFRLRHECPYRELSSEFPDLTIREWYLSDCQVLELSSDNAPEEELIERIDGMGTILHRAHDDGLRIVTKARLCSIENTIVDRFESYNCLYQPPTVHRQGWEEYSLIAFDEADIRALHDDLAADRDMEIVSETELEESEIPHSMLTPIDRLFGELTDRQLAALRLALENGYYNQPRACSIAELAEQTTVARATFEEHLRKAENKLLNSAGQFVHLLGGSHPDSGLRKDSEFPVAGAV